MAVRNNTLDAHWRDSFIPDVQRGRADEWRATIERATAEMRGLLREAPPNSQHRLLAAGALALLADTTRGLEAAERTVERSRRHSDPVNERLQDAAYRQFKLVNPTGTPAEFLEWLELRNFQVPISDQSAPEVLLLTKFGDERTAYRIAKRNR